MELALGILVVALLIGLVGTWINECAAEADLESLHTDFESVCEERDFYRARYFGVLPYAQLPARGERDEAEEEPEYSAPRVNRLAEMGF